LGGVLLASPLLFAFLGAFSGGRALDPDVRAAMGSNLELFPRPGLLEGVHPFAKTSWIGWIAPVLALASARRRPLLAAGVLLLFALSLGVGPWFALPVWEAIRFPYRLHAATLLGLGLLAGATVDRLRPGAGPLLALAITL